tara:strand:+ start:1576 stop:1824 length:249 start_codon:yes stop_codon:yes gene_type:complete
MKLIEFKEQTAVIAKDNPDYLPLPAHQFKDDFGTIAFCWKLTFKERLKVLFSGLVWQQVLTFNNPLQPQKMTIEKPEMNGDA